MFNCSSPGVMLGADRASMSYSNR